MFSFTDWIHSASCRTRVLARLPGGQGEIAVLLDLSRQRLY
jgi:hypothetical protein